MSVLSCFTSSPIISYHRGSTKVELHTTCKVPSSTLHNGSMCHTTSIKISSSFEENLKASIENLSLDDTSVGPILNLKNEEIFAFVSSEADDDNNNDDDDEDRSVCENEEPMRSIESNSFASRKEAYQKILRNEPPSIVTITTSEDSSWSGVTWLDDVSDVDDDDSDGYSANFDGRIGIQHYRGSSNPSFVRLFL
jgi:hypothetical protein